MRLLRSAEDGGVDAWIDGLGMFFSVDIGANFFFLLTMSVHMVVRFVLFSR